MIAGGLHASVDAPTTSSMFSRAGKPVSRKKDDGNSITEALTQAAAAISSALSPCPSSQPTGGVQGSSFTPDLSATST